MLLKNYCKKRIVSRIAILCTVVGVLVIYQVFDPAGSIFFPKCPFLMLTGLECPGCGSQRVVHALLNLDFVRAVKENVLIVLLIPYLLLCMVFDAIPMRDDVRLRWWRRLYGRRTILVICILIVLFFVIRNFTGLGI